MFPSVRDVLDLEPVRHGSPRVVAGHAALDRPVRWVHVAELPDIAGLLRGGELVLTTGIALPPGKEELREYVAGLAEAGAAGLVVELGRRFVGSLPRSMTAAAERAGLPLVELHREIKYVRITEAVHGLIVDARLAELRATEEIHQRFTEFIVEGAEVVDVVREVAQLAGAPVVLENLARQVLAYDAAGESAELLLDGWEGFSRRLRPAGRTGYDAATGWLVTTVGARGEDWGRLLLRCGSPAAPARILIEQAACALALDRLVRRSPDGLEQQVAHSLLTAILDHSRPVAEIALRARALGVSLDRRRLVGVVVRAHCAVRDLAEAVSQALREARLTGLVGALDEAVGVLLALPASGDEGAALTRFAEAVRHRRPAVVGVGSTVDSLREARRSLQEAGQVAEVAGHERGEAPYHRLTDVGLRGLLHLLRDDARLQTYVERELGPLLAHQAQRPREDLIGTLRAYLDAGRNKSAAAAAAHLSRPAFYERLHRIERVLGVDLESTAACLSLHVALLARDTLRAGASQPGGDSRGGSAGRSTA